MKITGNVVKYTTSNLCHTTIYVAERRMRWGKIREFWVDKGLRGNM
jgi:hypothetical protein